MPCKASPEAPLSETRGFNRKALPRMPVNRLLKSWAIPPARTPIASIFCDCRSCSSRFLRSVMSRAIPWIPHGKPAASRSR